MNNINDNDDENQIITPYITALIVAVCLIALVLGIVLILNKDKINIKEKKHSSDTVTANMEGYIDVSEYVSGSNLVSGDLDIWDEYLDEEGTQDTTEAETEEMTVDTVPEPEDPSKGGTKTKVVKKDGSEVWIDVNKYLKQNTLDNASFVLKNGRLSYYENGEKVSYSGIIIDKNDDYIDYNKVKKDNIDFVLIKLGQRGYSTGNITIDEKFYDNLKNAKDAGLHVGVLFSSQAVSKEEAEEEAQFVLDTLGENIIDYPVCFYMNYVSNDKSRVEDIGPEQKGFVAKSFMDKINEAGLNTVLYGDKEWLLCEMNYTSISYYDILLDEEEDIPDFPYRFTMWKYSTSDVSGVSGKSELIVSLVDYSVK